MMKSPSLLQSYNTGVCALCALTGQCGQLTISGLLKHHQNKQNSEKCKNMINIYYFCWCTRKEHPIESGLLKCACFHDIVLVQWHVPSSNLYQNKSLLPSVLFLLANFWWAAWKVNTWRLKFEMTGSSSRHSGLHRGSFKPNLESNGGWKRRLGMTACQSPSTKCWSRV